MGRCASFWKMGGGSLSPTAMQTLTDRGNGIQIARANKKKGGSLPPPKRIDSIAAPVARQTVRVRSPRPSLTACVCYIEQQPVGGGRREPLPIDTTERTAEGKRVAGGGGGSVGRKRRGRPLGSASGNHRTKPSHARM